MKTVRYSFHREIAPTTPDTADVMYGDMNNVDLSTARLLPPCAPTKIVCVGRNYPEHARELGNEVPAEPLIFMKPPSSLIADGDKIVYPAISQRVDYEGELGVIIGRRARRVSREQAFEYVRRLHHRQRHHGPRPAEERRPVDPRKGFRHVLRRRSLPGSPRRDRYFLNFASSPGWMESSNRRETSRE